MVVQLIFKKDNAAQVWRNALLLLEAEANAPRETLTMEEFNELVTAMHCVFPRATAFRLTQTFAAKVPYPKEQKTS